MNTYIVAYCPYNPDGQYFGHRLVRVRANDMEEAERLAHEELNKLAGKGKWEYVISLSLPESSHRVFDTRTGKRA